MSEWISVDDRLPRNASKGIWDSVKYLCFLSNGDYAVIVWMNNSFYGFPSGATDVIYWADLVEPEPPK